MKIVVFQRQVLGGHLWSLLAAVTKRVPASPAVGALVACAGPINAGGQGAGDEVKDCFEVGRMVRP